jgi:hypothetical protein
VKEITSGRYRHYSGNLYDVIGVAADVSLPDPPRRLVIYRSVGNGVLWARSVEEWQSPAIVDGQDVPRYVPVTEDDPNAD